MPLPSILAEVKPAGNGRKELLCVHSPYHPSFAPAARKLGGVWYGGGRYWQFDPRDSDRVAALCTEVYGYDWMSIHTTETVDIALVFDPRRAPFVETLFSFGRELVRKLHREIALGNGVLLLAGGFKGESTSCTLEIRDLPVEVVDRHRDWWAERDATITIVTPTFQRTLPREPSIIQVPVEHDPAVESILRNWQKLDARTQGKVLEMLTNDLPSVRG